MRSSTSTTGVGSSQKTPRGQEAAPELARLSDLPFEEFYVHLLALGLNKALVGEQFSDNECILALGEAAKDLDLLVTTHRAIAFERDRTRLGGTKVRKHVHQLDAVASSRWEPGSSSDPSGVVLALVDGTEIKLSAADSVTGRAVAFAVENKSEEWLASVELPEAQGDREAVTEFMASDDGRHLATELARGPRPASRAGSNSTVPAESGSQMEFLRLVTGIAAFILFLRMNGAPLFEGGPEVMYWLSQDGNVIYLVGAIALGLLSPGLIWRR